VLGPSGAGKELTGRGLHLLCARRDRSFVARNAATLPPTLADAELFGHARNYPNAGMPEREGLLGEAAGGTLFLDEVGELRTGQLGRGSGAGRGRDRRACASPATRGWLVMVLVYGLLPLPLGLA